MILRVNFDTYGYAGFLPTDAIAECGGVKWRSDKEVGMFMALIDALISQPVRFS